MKVTSAQIFVSVRAPYPQLNRVVSIEFCLGQKLMSYTIEDPPPSRPLTILIYILHILDASSRGGTDCQQAVYDLTWIASFSFLKLVKYCRGITDKVSTPFRIRDIQFFIGNQSNLSTTTTFQYCSADTFVSILLTDQKNGVKLE